MSRTILLYASSSGKLQNLLAAAPMLAQKLQADKAVGVIAGSGSIGAARQCSQSGADAIAAADTGSAAVFPETAAAILQQLAAKYQADVIVMPHEAFEIETAGRLAAKLQAACVTNAADLSVTDDGRITAEKLIYGGVVTAAYAAGPGPFVATLHESALRQLRSDSQGKSAEIAEEEVSLPSSGKKLVHSAAIQKTVDLKGAQRIVSIGRGLSKQEDLPIIEQLAEALDAQMGCSRPLVEDYKWMKLERQVGLTGTTVTPRLYMAVGISGQIQHIVGMKDSEIIVAINSNRNAPIFDYADYGIVGDLYEVVPQLIEAAKRQKAANQT